MKLQCGDKTLDLDTPKIMGILNITPDSFSDGGLLFDDKPRLNAIYSRSVAMVEAGARILDVGGESTRPGAIVVSAQEEMDRVLPVIEVLRELPVVLSVDTSSEALMREAVKLGVGIINDVRALDKVDDLSFLSNSSVAICLMHMQGQPDNMQNSPQYENVIDEVSWFLNQRVERCEQAGIERLRLILDPGFGFGKTLAHNLSLLKNMSQLKQLGLPLLAGISRKSMLAAILDQSDVSERLIGSVSSALIALQNGASIIRVHDVAESADMLKIFNAVQAAS